MAHWSATCISSETSDTNLSVLIDCDTSRYLFNCGEGTTRTLLQRKKGFRKFKAIFASGVDTERTSGLPGLLMTLADSGTSKIDVFGPPGLNHFLASTRLYTMRDSLSLKAHEINTYSSSPICTDENLSVFAVPVLPETRILHASYAPSTSSLLKRKRASSCESQLPSCKKDKTASEVIAGVVSPKDMSTEKLDPSIWDSKSFEASNLTGPEATAWRQLVVQHMFPGKPPAAHREVIVGSSAGSGGAKNSTTMMQFNKRLPCMTREPVSLSYIILGALGRGKFDVTKAAALGLKAGPARGRLAKGETVVTPEGNTITPDMVLGDPPRPEVMIFIDCPSPLYVEGLACSEGFRRFQKEGEHPVHCIVHLAGPGVLEDARYRKWMTTFGDGVHHLFTGPGRTPDRITFTSSAYAQLRLSHLDPDVFRVPKVVNLPCKRPDDVSQPLKMEGIRNNHFVAMKPAKAPVVPCEDDGIDLFHPAIQRGGCSDATSLLQPKTIEIYEQARKLVADHQRHTLAQPGDNVIVTPLGTSSAMPSKYRNVSSLIVHIPGSGYILLDCGEGTLGQLRRHFGDDTQEVLRNIRCIFISHIHGDHHMGVSRLLSQRRKLDPTCTFPIYLITNQPTFMYLQEYNDIEDLGLDDQTSGVRIIYSEHAHFSRRPLHTMAISLNERLNAESSQTAIHDLNSALGLDSIVTVDVWHRGKCYGIVIKHRDGWSIVYSGDTRPTDTLVRTGRNATLLIHEATLGDDQAEAAALKAHSTVGQAIDVAKRMRAKNVLLTHFSNRFPKTPQMSNESPKNGDPVIAVAFDHMNISIRDMWKMNRYLFAVEQSFLDSEDPEDEVVEALRNAP